MTVNFAEFVNFFTAIVLSFLMKIRRRAVIHPYAPAAGLRRDRKGHTVVPPPGQDGGSALEAAAREVA